jgi:hypothetical protein
MAATYPARLARKPCMPLPRVGYRADMDKGNQHGPRTDEALEHEVQSLVTGSPVESRVEPGRLMEDAADGEPVPEAFVGGAPHEPDAGLTAEQVRARSELATSLRPSIFPATRDEVIRCAIEGHAPDATIELLGKLPFRSYENVAQVWEGLGGGHEERGATHQGDARDPEPEVPPLDPAVTHPADSPEAATAPDNSPPRRAEPSVHRFGFRFDRLYRIAAAPLGIDHERAYVEIEDDRMLRARFGPWLVETPLANVTGACPTGPYSVIKTIGPAHLSLADRGLTFATNREQGVCITFERPVTGLDPLGVVLHPALTVTVDDVDALLAELESIPATA